MKSLYFVKTYQHDPEHTTYRLFTHSASEISSTQRSGFFSVFYMDSSHMLLRTQQHEFAHVFVWLVSGWTACGHTVGHGASPLLSEHVDGSYKLPIMAIPCVGTSESYR